MINFLISDPSLITNLSLSDGAYRLLAFLLHMCYGDKITCFPSQKYMAVSLGRSVRTIQRYLKELEKNGLIVIRRRGSTSNLYTILAKKIQQAGQKVAGAIKNAYNASKNAKKGKASNFNNFEQRNYDFDKLESALLGQGNFEYEELLE